MADEATDALVPEAPSTEAAAPTEAPAPDPYQPRYESLRKEFDRKNALLDRATKGDIEAIRELGFDYDEPDPTPEEYEDPYASKLTEYEQKISELEQWKQAQEAERIASGIRSHVDSLAQQEGLELSDYDKEVIFRGAVSGEKIDSEATEAAYRAHADYLKSRFPKEEEIPARPGTGQAVVKDYDPVNATDAERLAYMQARMGHGGPIT